MKTKQLLPPCLTVVVVVSGHAK